MKTKLLSILTLLLIGVSGAWADDVVYALDNDKRTGDAEPYTYTYTFSETKYQNKTIKVEVPNANSAGTITFKSNGTSSERLLYIYKSNGTVKDESRSFPMNPKDWVTAINYWPSDIKTEGDPGEEKYYLIFSTTADWKSVGVKFTCSTLADKYTVTFEAGSNGTCGTASLTESTIGYGVTLPAVTANTGYVFNGWYTAASDGTKVGDAADTYHPTANVTIYAQYSVAVAPTITNHPADVEATGGDKVVLSVEADGTPAPTYQWYTCNKDGSSPAEIAGATSATYVFSAPAYDSEGTNEYYYKVVATNSASSATSDVATLTVNNKLKFSAYLTATAKIATTSNCSFAFYSKDGSEGNIPAGTACDGYYYAKMNDNANFYQLTSTAGGNKFKAGDKLIVYLYGSSTTGAYKLSSAETKTEVSENTITAGKINAVEHTLTAADIESDGTIRIYRNGSNTFFAGAAVVGTTSLTIAATYKYATFVTTNAIDMTKANADGVKAYIVTGKGEATVTTEEVTAVPANTAILLKADDETGHTVSVDDIVSATLSSTNKLKYSTTAVDGDGSTIYGFFKVGDEYGFAPVASGSQIAAYKAYLEISGGTLSANFLTLDFGETTSIREEVKGKREKLASAQYYNLAGQRVAEPQKGLYIVNGKKLIIK